MEEGDDDGVAGRGFKASIDVWRANIFV